MSSAQPQRRQTDGSAFPSAKKSRSPESARYDELKTKRVLLGLYDGTQITGILHWVDRYTLGVEVETEWPAFKPGSITILQKGFVAAIGEPNE